MIFPIRLIAGYALPLFLQALAMSLFGRVDLMAVKALAETEAATGILTAIGRPGWTLALSGPLLPMAVVGHWILVPRLGAVGAAAITTLLAWLGAVVIIAAIFWHFGVRPTAVTISRTLLTTLLAYAVSVAWNTSGQRVVFELVTIAGIALAGLVALGELTRRDAEFIRSLFWRQRIPPPTLPE